MNIELLKEDVQLIRMLLSKAEVETRVEIHHAHSFEYKNYLKERDKHITDLIQRLDKAAPAAA